MLPLLVAGSANMDLVVRVKRFPKPGETCFGTDFATFPGGKGANQAVASGRLGGDVSFAGCVGSDGFGLALGDSLRAAGVKTDGLSSRREFPTGTALITVDEGGQNTIVVVPGANDAFDHSFACSLESGPKAVLLVQLEIPLEGAATILGHKRFSTRILNPAPARSLPDDVLDGLDFITPNETEAEMLTGVLPTDDASCLKAAAVLLDRGVRNVIVTLGDKGAFHASEATHQHYPTLKIHAVDTTAAGDAFNGALALFLAQGRSLGNAIELANCVGALSAMKHGAQVSMPTLEELREVAEPLL